MVIGARAAENDIAARSAAYMGFGKFGSVRVNVQYHAGGVTRRSGNT